MFSKVQKFILVILIFATTLVWYMVFAREPHELRVSALDVGQGDSIFIETPLGRRMLVDGGSGSKVLSELGDILPAYDRHIDIVVSTHTDLDHVGGLVDVLKRYDVDLVVINGYTASTTIYETLSELLKKNDIEIHRARAGDRIVLDRNITFDILGPFESDFYPWPKASNEVMIVGQLVFGESEFLLTGDIERGDEIRLVSSGANLESDVLKVAHHGSKYSTTKLFLQAVHPDISLVSVGAKNRYGHPTPETLDRLSNIGTRILRTDREGRVTILSDGTRVWVP